MRLWHGLSSDLLQQKPTSCLCPQGHCHWSARPGFNLESLGPAVLQVTELVLKTKVGEKGAQHVHGQRGSVGLKNGALMGSYPENRVLSSGLRLPAPLRTLRKGLCVTCPDTHL